MKHTLHLVSGLRIPIKQTRAHYKININHYTPRRNGKKGHSKKFKQFSCWKGTILITDTIN